MTARKVLVAAAGEPVAFFAQQHHCGVAIARRAVLRPHEAWKPVQDLRAVLLLKTAHQPHELQQLRCQRQRHLYIHVHHKDVLRRRRREDQVSRAADVPWKVLLDSYDGEAQPRVH